MTEQKILWMVGGSGDIGEGFAKKFGTNNWNFVFSGRDIGRLKKRSAQLEQLNIKHTLIQLDAGQEETIKRGIEQFSNSYHQLDIMVYNISPQSHSNETRLKDFLTYTAIGMSTFLYELKKKNLLPRHIIIPTSSRLKTYHGDPEYFTSKQALFQFTESFSNKHGITSTILWLGKRGTLENWRWLYPSEMAEKGFESYLTRESQILVGDLY